MTFVGSENSRLLVSEANSRSFSTLHAPLSTAFKSLHAPPQAVPPAQAGIKIKSVKISPRSGTGATQSYWRHEVVLAAEGDWRV